MGKVSNEFKLKIVEEGFNVIDNFDIFDLNTDTGEYKVIREGHKNQY